MLLLVQMLLLLLLLPLSDLCGQRGGGGVQRPSCCCGSGGDNGTATKHPVSSYGGPHASSPQEEGEEVMLHWFWLLVCLISLL